MEVASDSSSNDDVCMSSCSDETEEVEPTSNARTSQTEISQKKILDIFFNPRRKKQNYVSSWLDSCHFEKVFGKDVWNSAVLMPRCVFFVQGRCQREIRAVGAEIRQIFARSDRWLKVFIPTSNRWQCPSPPPPGYATDFV